MIEFQSYWKISETKHLNNLLLLEYRQKRLGYKMGYLKYSHWIFLYLILYKLVGNRNIETQMLCFERKYQKEQSGPHQRHQGLQTVTILTMITIT